MTTHTHARACTSADSRILFRSAILATLGHAPDDIETGTFQRFSTNGKRGDSSGWCRLFDDQQGGVFGCFRQAISDQWSAKDRTTMTRGERAAHARQIAQATQERDRLQCQQRAKNAQRNADLWAACRPLVAGDTVTRYLTARLNGELWPLPDALRFHPALPYWHEGQELGRFPAMVAALTSQGGDLLALHRTYLTPDGHKANVPTVKKITASGGPLVGGCIRLAQPHQGRIGIAEGIETALAASKVSGVPTVAAYSAGALAGWCWPNGTRSLVIFGDADKAGRDAAQTLSHRARSHGLGVQVLTPNDEGADWCDVVANVALSKFPSYLRTLPPTRCAPNGADLSCKPPTLGIGSSCPVPVAQEACHE